MQVSRALYQTTTSRTLPTILVVEGGICTTRTSSDLRTKYSHGNLYRSNSCVYTYGNSFPRITIFHWLPLPPSNLVEFSQDPSPRTLRHELTYASGTWPKTRDASSAISPSSSLYKRQLSNTSKKSLYSFAAALDPFP